MLWPVSFSRLPVRTRAFDQTYAYPMLVRDGWGRAATFRPRARTEQQRPHPVRRVRPIRWPAPPDGSSFETALAHYNIVQARFSSVLEHLQERACSRYGLQPYTSKTAPTLFAGLYDVTDRVAFASHRRGARFLRPGGGDLRLTCELAMRDERAPVVAVSRDIQRRLLERGVRAPYVRWNIVDSSLFRPLPLAQRGSKVYVYNGRHDACASYALRRAHTIYGQPLVDAVIRRRPKLEFVLSGDGPLVPYAEMPAVYGECCIALRLTRHDGTANMVQELEAMGIPVVHNQSDYGLKWGCLADILRHVDAAVAEQAASVK